MDVRFKVPSNFYISGQSQCGKSYLVRRLLYYLNDLFHPVPSKVVYCYGEYQKEFDDLHGVEFIEGFPEDLNTLTQGHEQTLLVLDDLMGECSKDQRVSDLFTRDFRIVLDPKFIPARKIIENHQFKFPLLYRV